MHTARVMTKGSCIAFGVFLSLALLVPVSEAQFKVTDNFNRADGAPGLGWSRWGNGAQISGSQLETFGQTNVAGGIQRTLDITFPVSFSFDFSTNTPSDGGWLIAFNATASKLTDGTPERHCSLSRDHSCCHRAPSLTKAGLTRMVRRSFQ
jgi:hypothetical protein